MMYTVCVFVACLLQPLRASDRDCSAALQARKPADFVEDPTSIHKTLFISSAKLRQICLGMRVNVIDNAAILKIVQNESYWAAWGNLSQGTPDEIAIADCIDAQRRDMRSFRIGVARNVALVPLLNHPSGLIDFELIDASPCTPEVDRAAITLNKFGVAYYHSMYDDLASVVWMLEEIREKRTHLVLNRCIDAHVKHVFLADPAKFPTVCHNASYVFELLDIFGIKNTTVVQYPRQEGKLLLGEARIVLSKEPSPSRRSVGSGFFQPMHFRTLAATVMLQQAFDDSLDLWRLPSPNKRYILLVDRNDTNLPWHRIDGSAHLYDTARVTGNQQELEASLREEFEPKLDVVVFGPPYGSIRRQAYLFSRASAIVGPHGAAESNMIFCRPSTIILEFTRAKHVNSPLYAGLAHALGLRYWTVPCASLRQVNTQLVIRSLKVALFGGSRAVAKFTNALLSS